MCCSIFNIIQKIFFINSSQRFFSYEFICMLYNNSDYNTKIDLMINSLAHFDFWLVHLHENLFCFKHLTKNNIKLNILLVLNFVTEVLLLRKVSTSPNFSNLSMLCNFVVRHLKQNVYLSFF